MLPLNMDIRIIECLDANGVSPFKQWFDKVESNAAARITTYIGRLSIGNFSNLRVLVQVLWSLKLILGQGTEFILEKMAID